MKILAVHNFYQQPGGEDQVFYAETALLESYGHKVARYMVHNDTLNKTSSLVAAQKTIWNHSVYQEMQRLIQQNQIEIVHFYNTFPLISPAAYYAVRDARLPIIQSLHNFRLLCPSAIFYRSGHVCEDCLGKIVPWPAIVHACYHNSRAITGVTTAMLVIHRFLKTWTKMVDIYVAGFPEFARQKFSQSNIPIEKIRLKPNFVYPDPGIGNGRGGYALFVGRFAPEKGILTVLQAWKNLKEEIPLKIVGDGDLVSQVTEASQKSAQIEWVGRKSLDEMYEIMKDASFLIFPSTWYEAMPRTIIDAFAVGTPVIAANIGAMSNMIRHGETGLHFKPNDVQDLVRKIEWILAHPTELSHMRLAARAEFDKMYTAEANYKMLMDIYQETLNNKGGE